MFRVRRDPFHKGRASLLYLLPEFRERNSVSLLERLNCRAKPSVRDGDVGTFRHGLDLLKDDCVPAFGASTRFTREFEFVDARYFNHKAKVLQTCIGPCKIANFRAIWEEPPDFYT